MCTLQLVLLVVRNTIICCWNIVKGAAGLDTMDGPVEADPPPHRAIMWVPGWHDDNDATMDYVSDNENLLGDNIVVSDNTSVSDNKSETVVDMLEGMDIIPVNMWMSDIPAYDENNFTPEYLAGMDVTPTPRQTVSLDGGFEWIEPTHAPVHGVLAGEGGVMRGNPLPAYLLPVVNVDPARPVSVSSLDFTRPPGYKSTDPAAPRGWTNPWVRAGETDPWAMDDWPVEPAPSSPWALDDDWPTEPPPPPPTRQAVSEEDPLLYRPPCKDKTTGEAWGKWYPATPHPSRRNDTTKHQGIFDGEDNIETVLQQLKEMSIESGMGDAIENINI